MAKKRKKVAEVKKFSGTDNLGTLREEGNYEVMKGTISTDKVSPDTNWDLNAAAVESETKIEHDEGVGNAAVVRTFTFGANPEVFAQHKPTRQELFNAHYKGIEQALWRDGLKVIPEVNPQVRISDDGKSYAIVVGAEPMRGHILTEKPSTLKELLTKEEVNG